MNNILKTFKNDFKRIFVSAWTIVLVIAMAALPALYAWLNVYACWDPYGNVGDVLIAVYTEDQNYTLDDGTVVNLSDGLMNDLKAESDLGWTSVNSRDEAVDGVYDGTYYAAVVIDQGFTADMFNFDRIGEIQPTVTFYQNQKKNAIGTRMTDSACTTLERCINQAYVKALITTVFGHLNRWNEDVDALMDDTDASQTELERLKTNMDGYMASLEAFIEADKRLIRTVDNSDALVGDAIGSINTTIANMNAQTQYIENMRKNLASDVYDTTESLTALQKNVVEMSDIVKRISDVDTLTDMSKMLKDTKRLLQENVAALHQIQKVLDLARDMDGQLDDVGIATCDSVTYLLNQTDSLLDYLDNNYTRLTAFSNNLKNVFTASLRDSGILANYTYLVSKGYDKEATSTFVTAILLTKNLRAGSSDTISTIAEFYAAKYSGAVGAGMTPEQATDYATGEVQTLFANSAAYAATKSSSELLTEALTYLAGDTNGTPTAVKDTTITYYNSDGTTGSNVVAYVIAYVISPEASTVMPIINNIETRAATLEKQYTYLKSDLDSVLTNMGKLGDALSDSNAGSDSMRAMRIMIDADLDDTIAQLNELSHISEGSSSSQQDIYDAQAKVSRTKREVAYLKKVFQDVNTDSMYVDADDLIIVLEELEGNIDEMQGVIEDAQYLLDTTGDAQALLLQVADLAGSTVDFINDKLYPELDDTMGQMEDVMDDISALLIKASGTLNDSRNVLDTVSISLYGANNSLSAVQDVLEVLIGRIDPILEDIDDVQDSEIINDLRRLMGLDPIDTGAFFASPVDMVTNTIYPVDNYGSGMAPFYTSLAIWIGNIIIAAVFKTKASTKGLKDPKLWHMFFGRYILFLLLNEIQALIILLGELFILRIQCSSPGLFILTGMITALAFSILIYALVYAMGVLGKAASVLLFIMQVAGSGGTYPVELLPEAFQIMHVFLPFDYSIGAMRACIAGTYGHDLGKNLIILLLIVIASIAIGLKSASFYGFSHYMEERMEETGIL